MNYNIIFFYGGGEFIQNFEESPPPIKKKKFVPYIGEIAVAALNNVSGTICLVRSMD